MVEIGAHRSVRQYASPPEIPPYKKDKDDKIIVTKAHHRWAHYLGALLSPWGTGYGSDDYGKAEVDDWYSLMKWFTKDVKPEPSAKDDEEYQAMTPKQNAAKAADDAARLNEETHRTRCLRWLLNSMARNLGFDRNKAKLWNKWRFEFARKVKVSTQSRESEMDKEIRMIVNTLTLTSLDESQLPRSWHRSQEQLRNLGKDLKKMYCGRTDVGQRVGPARYQSNKTHHTRWVKQQLEFLKQPLPSTEDEKMDDPSPHPRDLEKRLEKIINGQGTKEPGAPLDESQTRVVRETFALAMEPKQFLILVDGGPGTGKTRTTARLAEALSMLGMTTAYTGSTGTAATNYVGGLTLHSMMGLGRKMPSGKNLASKYNNYSTKRDVKKRLGGSQPGKIVLVIDEISAITYDVFGTTEKALRLLYGNEEPFGGVNVILVGDFDQKLPVAKGGSLAQVLVNSVTDAMRHMSGAAMRRRNAAAAFSRFTKYELKTNHRIDGKQEKLRGLLKSMRDNQDLQPITRKFLERLPQLKRFDRMGTAEQTKWRFCPIMCTGNATRQRINELQVLEFGKTNNRPILEFYDGLSNITDPDELKRLSRMIRLKNPIKHYFVSGAPAILTQNIRGYAHRGLVNSARGTMCSMTWNEKDHKDPTVEAWYKGKLEGGKVYRVPFPHAVNVKMTKTGDLFPVVQTTRSIELPSTMAAYLGLRKKLRVTTHKVDLGFAFTDYRVQGLTVKKLIIMLNKQLAPHDLATLYVGISRVKRLADLKIWPIDCTDERAIKHLVSIKRPQFIRVWRKGYDKNGRWIRSQLDYTKWKRETKLLEELGDPDELNAKTVVELKRLVKSCGFALPRLKTNMIKRLKRMHLELTERANNRSTAKRNHHPSHALPQPSPKRRKPAPRQRRGRIKLPVYPELVGESDSSDDETSTSTPASHNPPDAESGRNGKARTKRKHHPPRIVEPPPPKRRKRTPKRRPEPSKTFVDAAKQPTQIIENEAPTHIQSAAPQPNNTDNQEQMWQKGRRVIIIPMTQNNVEHEGTVTHTETKNNQFEITVQPDNMDDRLIYGPEDLRPLDEIHAIDDEPSPAIDAFLNDSDGGDDETQTPALASHNPPNTIPRSRNTNPRSRSRDRRPRARADAPPRHSSSSSQGTNSVAPTSRGYVSV